MDSILIALTLFATYVLYVCATAGRIPPTLSETVLVAPYPPSWLWTLVIGAVAFLTIPTLISLTNEPTRFLAFFCCAGLAFVAACPLFPKDEDNGLNSMTYKIHVTSAWVCAITSQLLILFNCWPLLLVWIPWAAYFLLTPKGRRCHSRVFWAEMVCFLSIFAFCLVQSKPTL